MLPCPAVAAASNPLLRPPGRTKPGGLASMSLGCLGIVVLCCGVGFAVLQLLPLPPSGDPMITRVFAALIGGVGGLGLSSVISMAFGYGRGAGSLGPLLARARSDGPAEDGQPIIATGVVRADRPLVSPIGGIACVAYDYRMTRPVAGAGRKDEPVPVYWGYASQPFHLDSRSRGYAVSAAGLQAGRATRDDSSEARTRARQYERSTRWETVEYRMLGALDTVRQRLEDDAPTGTRKDFAADSPEPVDVALLAIEENVLPVGATVSAFGTWSATYGMIVAPPSPLPGSHVILVEGGPDKLKDQPGVPHATRANVVGAIVLLAIAAGLFWIAGLIIPTVKG
jgi:hypothetical protein